MRITAPSPISAVLSATAASLAGASLPRWELSVGSPLDSASASEPTVSPGSKPATSDSSATNAPSTNTSRRVSTSPSKAPAVFARALAAASGGAASGLASRISARKSVYFQSSMRRCGRPILAKTSNAAARCSAIAPSPGSRPRACEKACASAVSAAVLMMATSAFTPEPLPGIRHSRALRARAPIPCRRS